MANNVECYCSFCLKTKEEVPNKRLVVSSNGESSICLSCAEDSINLISINEDFLYVNSVLDTSPQMDNPFEGYCDQNKTQNMPVENIKRSVDIAGGWLSQTHVHNQPHQETISIEPSEQPNSFMPKVIKTPSEIKSLLSVEVVGQESAKKTLAVAAYNHSMRLKAISKKSEHPYIEKSNLLLIGKTGTGKTLLARNLARVMELPFAEMDATTITSSGYTGSDAQDCISALLAKSNYDVDLASKGVIFIDEIDKLKKSTNSDNDVGGEGAQQALLKLLEGTVVNVTVKHRGEDVNYEVDTSNILFIAGGSFSSLVTKEKESSIGFSANVSNASDNSSGWLDGLKNQHLANFGLTKEILGRFPIKVTLDDLEPEDIERILTEPKGSLVNQYKHLFSLSGCELNFEPDALRSIALQAYNEGVGARGLRAIMEKKLEDVMFDMPSTDEVSRSVLLTESGAVFT